MQSITSNAVYQIVKTKLKYVNTTGQSISDLATAMNDVDFFTKVLQKIGTPCLMLFPYAWASDCKISFYEGSTLKGTVNTNGGCIMLVAGSLGGWGELTYVVFGGINNTGTKNNALAIGSITYNGGSTLVRHCNFI